MSSSSQNKNKEKVAEEDNPATPIDTHKNSPQEKATKSKTGEEVHEERIERMLTACRRIWGSYTDFDLDCKLVEQDGVKGWSVQIRKAYGDRLGVQEMWTLVKETEEEAWVNMEELLNETVVSICWNFGILGLTFPPGLILMAVEWSREIWQIRVVNMRAGSFRRRCKKLTRIKGHGMNWETLASSETPFKVLSVVWPLKVIRQKKLTSINKAGILLEPEHPFHSQYSSVQHPSQRSHQTSS